MAGSIQSIWAKLKEILRLYNRDESSFYPACTESDIERAESELGFALPEDLKALLRLNNGQKRAEGSVGIFKSLSGWDVYRRHGFLSAAEIALAYRAFVSDAVLRAEFGAEQIPFGVAGNPEHFEEAFCIQRESGAVSLIWCAYPDPLSPAEWQVQRFPRGESLAAFLEKQIGMYQ
jgi:hypothetical protein